MLKTKEKIIEWLNAYKVMNYTINEDLTVDVNDNVNLGDKSLIELPIQFNIILGSFNVAGNKLKNLKGCPKEVTGSFSCDHNDLESLEGGPIKVNGSFDCSRNKLKTLEYAPEKKTLGFFCNNNQLISLKGSPKYISGGFYCGNNKLTNLQFCPEIITGMFDGNSNRLNTIEWLPKEVKGFTFALNDDLGELQKFIDFKELLSEQKRIKEIYKHKLSLDKMLKNNEIKIISNEVKNKKI